VPRIHEIVAAPNVNTPLRGPQTSLGRQATAEDVGYDIAPSDAVPRAIDQLARGLTETFAIAAKNKRAADLGVAKSNAALELQQFSFELNNGSVGQDGVRRPPARPEEAPRLYQEKVREIQERYKGQLDGGSFGLWDEDFQKVAQLQGFDVQKRSIEALQGEERAALDVTIDTHATAAANAPDLLRPRLLDQGQLAIQDAEDRGTLTPEEALAKRRQFQELVVRAEITRAIREDAENAYNILLAGPLEGLNVKEQEELTTEAYNAMVRQDREAVAAENARLQLDENRLKLRRGEFTKALANKKREGTLTAQYVIDNEYLIEPQHYSGWLEEAQRDEAFENELTRAAEEVNSQQEAEDVFAKATEGAETGRVDRAVARNVVEKAFGRTRETPRYVKTDLNRELRMGTLEYEKLDKLYADRQLSDSDYEKYTKDIDTLRKNPLDPILKTEQALTARFFDEFNSTTPQSEAAAQEFTFEVEDFLAKHKRKPNSKELLELSDDVFRRQWNEDTRSILPRLFDGDPANPTPADIQATGKKLMPELLKMSPEAGRRELHRLRVLQQIAESKRNPTSAKSQ